MIHISEMIMKALLAIDKCKIGDKVIFKTCKKDRQIIIQKEEEGCTIIEEGFEREVFSNVSLDDLPKLLKKLKEKEFPRSNQLWYSVHKMRE